MNDSKLKKIAVAEAVAVIGFTTLSFALGGIKCGIPGLVLGILLFVMSYLEYKTGKREIEKLNTYLERVLAGESELEIMDQGEGEYYILKSNIYKATSALIIQRERLQKDKTFMADAIADISHQFKTPLTSLFVMNDLLKEEQDGAKRKEFLDTQRNQLQKMNWLIQTLLKISKLDAGLLEFKKETVSDSDLIKETLAPFLVQMDIRNISCNTDLKGSSIKCDKHWTLEALQNIVKNCIEHLPEGGALEIKSSESNIFYEIVISDNGPGIDKEDLPHIFERFYRGKNAGAESVGIGLSLAKTIIENQSGEIKVSSKEGSGTTFVIKLYKTIV